MPPPPSLSRPVRALVIGAGPAALAMHLPCLAQLRDRGALELALVCDLLPERAAAARVRFGFAESSTDALAAIGRAEVDVVYIFASAQLHHGYGLAALRGGKHLFVEKPVAPGYAQAQELAQAAHTHRLIAVGGHNRRFYPSLLRARATAGHTGWRLAEAIFHKPEFHKQPPYGSRTWLGANGIHALDALLYVMGGLPEQLTALTADFGAPVPSSFSALLRWRDGRQGVFLCNNSAGLRREEYVFHAPAETCTATEEGVSIAKDGKTIHTSLPAMPASVRSEHEAFLQAIATGAEPAHSLASIAPSLLVAELIEAGASGAVSLPDAAPAAVESSAALRSSPLSSILIAQAESLQPALAGLSPPYRLVALEELRDLTAPRTDIVAAILGRGSPPLEPAILDKLPNLAVVGVAGLSLARYAPAALLARGIALLNASDAYAESVAEFALGLAILGRRRAFTCHEDMRRGGWGTGPRRVGLRGRVLRLAPAVRPLAARLGIEGWLRRVWHGMGRAGDSAAAAAQVALLEGATVGLIGWGANARAFARRLLQGGARVRVYSAHASVSELRSAQVEPAALAEVLTADIVSLHRGLNPSTHHGLDGSALARLRPGAVLINVARGALIDPDALLGRLRRGDVFACLDTFEEEPLPASHPLRRLPNVFLTAHIGGGSADMHAAAAAEVVAKVARYLSGERTGVITAAQVDSMT